MIKNIIKERKGLIRLVIIATAFSYLSSCADSTTGGTTCVKCIDNKPPATAFSNTLNAIHHSIPLPQAITMIDNYNALQDSLLATVYKSSNTLPVYETFNLKAIDSLICQKNTVGFRIYMAMDEQQKVRFVLVGVDGDGKDIIQRQKESPERGIADLGDVSILVEEAGQRWP